MYFLQKDDQNLNLSFCPPVRPQGAWLYILWIQLETTFSLAIFLSHSDFHILHFWMECCLILRIFVRKILSNQYLKICVLWKYKFWHTSLKIANLVLYVQYKNPCISCTLYIYRHVWYQIGWLVHKPHLYARINSNGFKAPRSLNFYPMDPIVLHFLSELYPWHLDIHRLLKCCISFHSLFGKM